MAPLMASACGAGGEIDVGSAVGSFLLSMLLTVLVSVVVGKLLYFIIGLPIRSALKKASGAEPGAKGGGLKSPRPPSSGRSRSWSAHARVRAHSRKTHSF
mmetsp:Transcript_38004/g.122222  ORF Transcript_38004/g.122222 Transcript_38004/m.122222 type:complete len:100 (+) Transcript_38004:1100-1399(+)